MATRKKVKAKAKRRKAPAGKPAVRRKTAKAGKKPARKAPVRRAPRKAAKPAARPARAAKPTPVSPPPAQPVPPGERIGVVTHYFSHLSVAVVRLEAATLRVGDTIHIRGHTSDFSQRVESLQVEHAPAMEVGPMDDFGLKVIEPVREHDVVYKVRP
jgi:putative protease